MKKRGHRMHLIGRLNIKLFLWFSLLTIVTFCADLILIFLSLLFHFCAFYSVLISIKKKKRLNESEPFRSLLLHQFSTLGHQIKNKKRLRAHCSWCSENAAQPLIPGQPCPLLMEAVDTEGARKPLFGEGSVRRDRTIRGIICNRFKYLADCK